VLRGLDMAGYTFLALAPRHKAGGFCTVHALVSFGTPGGSSEYFSMRRSSG